MEKNPIIVAHITLQKHINHMLGTADSLEKRREELMKLKKEELVDQLLAATKVSSVKIEDIAKVILEDPACAWLDYTSIATAIVKAIPTAKTSDKCLASYACKNPRDKGWVVVPRKSQKERNQALLEALNQ